MDNKLRMKQGLEYFLIFVWAILTVMTCSAVWSFVSEVTLIVAAILLFGFNIVAMRQAIKKIKQFADNYDKEEEIK